ncbi:hypothetical protein HOH11_00340 [Candidatus Woesearchaeota archaeon]|jgi:hypothetical protein|nr:hypothetical protein [Candidatus Woesearchaeota archaeon]MBT6023041.1 hypothetical protein [Candidatus Woesearchaeota archaeon]
MHSLKKGQINFVVELFIGAVLMLVIVVASYYFAGQSNIEATAIVYAQNSKTNCQVNLNTIMQSDKFFDEGTSSSVISRSFITGTTVSSTSTTAGSCSDSGGTDVTDTYNSESTCVLTWDTDSSTCSDSDVTDVTTTFNSESTCVLTWTAPAETEVQTIQGIKQPLLNDRLKTIGDKLSAMLSKTPYSLRIHNYCNDFIKDCKAKDEEHTLARVDSGLDGLEGLKYDDDIRHESCVYAIPVKCDPMEYPSELEVCKIFAEMRLNY